MTKITPVRVGTDWRKELAFAAKCMAIGAAIAVVFVLIEGRV